MSVVGESRSTLSPESHGRNATAATAVATSARRRAPGCAHSGPREQSREREDARVVRVDRGARAGGVGRPPARRGRRSTAREQRRGSAPSTSADHQRVAARLGGVVDHERARTSSARWPRAPRGARRSARRAGRRAGSSAAPASSDGARSSSGVRSIRVVSQDATKYSGGVISASRVDDRDHVREAVAGHDVARSRARRRRGTGARPRAAAPRRLP